MKEEEFPLEIRKTGWFGQQPESFQSLVIRNGSVKHYAPGETVYNIGDQEGGIYCTLSGRLGVDVISDELGPFQAGYVGVGSWVGEGSYLTRKPRRVGLISQNKSVLFYLPMAAMDRIETMDHTAGRRFGHIAFMSVVSSIEIVSLLLIPEAERRVAAVIVRLLGQNPTKELHLTQMELGKMSNASRNSVGAALKKFEKAGWVKTKFQRIEITNEKGLRKYIHAAA